ncbi:MAG: cyclic nucleotide-binding domain-containing protein [Spirochaetales bacterium]|nr:cyclic nucleotide-binding domain-containing protein [Spirochaetales bacterium]
MSDALKLSLVNFKKGSYIIVEGKQKADSFYIIQTGKIKLIKEVEIVEEEGGSVLDPGDFFGVVSTMSNHSHIETALALTDVSLISVHRDQYQVLIKKNAPVAMKIIQGFSKKMRYLDENLTRLALRSTASTEPNHLFNVAEYYAKQNHYNQAYYAYYRFIQYCPDDENVKTAKERIGLIKPYAKAVYLEEVPDQFNRNYPKDTMIFSECEPGKELYIIQKGSVKITKIVDNNQVMLALLKPGDIFGEMALLENKPRSASAIAYEDCALLAVNKSNFEMMVKTQPQLITRLTTILAERIWFIYKQLANTMVKDPVGKLFDALYMQLEKNRIRIEPGENYTFEFGPKELLNMVGLPVAEGDALFAKVFENKKFRLVDNKIFTTDIDEVRKQAEYYKKMQKIEQSRRDSSKIK